MKKSRNKGRLESSGTRTLILEQLGLTPRVVEYYVEVGLVEEPFTDEDWAELRRIRRLQEDLGLDEVGIEIALRMRRRIMALQMEINRLEAERDQMEHALRMFRQIFDPGYPRLPGE